MQPIVTELVYQPINFAVLTIHGGRVTVHDPRLKNIFDQAGIRVPFAFRSAYNDQEAVKSSDPLFCRAVRHLIEFEGYRAPQYVWKETFPHKTHAIASSERD